MDRVIHACLPLFFSFNYYEFIKILISGIKYIYDHIFKTLDFLHHLWSEHSNKILSVCDTILVFYKGKPTFFYFTFLSILKIF